MPASAVYVLDLKGKVRYYLLLRLEKLQRLDVLLMESRQIDFVDVS